jgi:hypothetical protein
VLAPGQVATPMQEQVFDEETKAQFRSWPRASSGLDRLCVTRAPAQAIEFAAGLKGDSADAEAFLGATAGVVIAS